MPFQNVERVVFEKNPLAEVVCQVRFPQILLINKEPIGFQERIRKEYPLFETKVERQQKFFIDPNADESAPVRRILSSEQNNYRFSTTDNKWSINLSSTFLTLSTTSYTMWEEFFQRFETPLTALVDEYRPAFFERVGLRYIDVFKRSDLELENTPWNRLIKPFALGFVACNEVSSEVNSHQMIDEVELSDGAKVQIRSSLGYKGDDRSELCFILDSDFFVLKTELQNIPSVLQVLHSNATKLLRTIISDELYTAMRPNVIK